jgi:lipopolysaccharide transport system permease protein
MLFVRNYSHYSFASILCLLQTHRFVIWHLAKREWLSRYRGSWLGIGWALLLPLIMIFTYAFIFSGLFSVRWSGSSAINGQETVSYPVMLFAGLLLHGFVAECFMRAPSLMAQHVNLVKKVVFPLSVLPVSSVVSAAMHMIISVFIWIIFAALSGHIANGWMLLWIPLLLMPLLFLMLGASWLLAAFAVYVRDIGQIMQISLTLLLFFSPVLYPSTQFPESYRMWLYLNPLTYPVEALRFLVIHQDMSAWNWGVWAIYSVASLSVMWIGFITFSLLRRGFADVL